MSDENDSWLPFCSYLGQNVNIWRINIQSHHVGRWKVKRVGKRSASARKCSQNTKIVWNLLTPLARKRGLTSVQRKLNSHKRIYKYRACFWLFQTLILPFPSTSVSYSLAWEHLSTALNARQAKRAFYQPYKK